MIYDDRDHAIFSFFTSVSFSSGTIALPGICLFGVAAATGLSNRTKLQDILTSTQPL